MIPISEILKGARVDKQAVSAGELALINRQSLRALSAEEVFAFRVVACDNAVDRDLERFTDGALAAMAKLFVGRPVLQDHDWKAANQTARVYAGEVEDAENGVKRLVLRCYMLRSEATRNTIDAIEAGILREVSVGVICTSATCSICGRDYIACEHRRGAEYDGKVCHVVLDGVTDAYELSFVPVPAQPGAGVIKRYEDKEKAETPPPADKGADAPDKSELDLARARMELEIKRYGGNFT